MGSGLYSHTTRATGLTLTASIYNTDHVNHITNHNTTMIDDYSTNAAQMQTETDPYPAASPSLATSLAGELERIRYVIKQITGKAQWYIDPDTVAGVVNYRDGYSCAQASTTTITVAGGVIDVDGTTITKTSDTTLDLTVAGDWVDDTSDQATDTNGYIYINNAGKIEMDDVAPDESDTSGNTSGMLKYNDTGTDTSDRRIIGFFRMNSTGSGELDTNGVWTAESEVIQERNVQDGAVATGTTTMPLDDTIPQNTEGDEYMTLAITPTSATHKLKIKAIWNGSAANGTDQITMALFQDATANALAVTVGGRDAASPLMVQAILEYEMIAGTTSETTFKIRAGSDIAGTNTFNGASGGRYFGGIMLSGIWIEEVT